MSLRQESYPWFQPRLIGIVVISAAAVTSTAIVVGGWKATHAPDQPTHTMDVSAEATRHVTPDTLTWTITAHGHAKTGDDATRDLHQAIARARSFLGTHGFADAEITVKPMTLQHDDPTPADDEQVATDDASFDASQELDVTTKDVARGVKTYRDAVVEERDLIGAEVEEPSCTVSGADKLEQELLAEARHKVRSQAETALADYGGKLGRVVDAQVGTFDAGMSGVDGCSGGDATANASATFELE